MIRIHLTADDIGGTRIANAPDFSAELVRAGYLLANRMRTARLSGWERDVARGWNPLIAKLLDLYSRSVLPGIFDQVVQGDPAATAAAAAATDPGRAANYVRTLTRTRGMTPFTRALADGDASAYTALGRAVSDFQNVAVDPYRRQITAAVTGAAARASARAATAGTGALLRSLHPRVRWEKSTLSLDTVSDADLELNGRSLILRPSVFSVRPGHSGDTFSDALVVSYPASDAVLLRDGRVRAPSPALTALLGRTRAAVLVAVTQAPAVTTGQLAKAVGLSAAAASRHATVLRDAGLITTLRDGMTVHHHATRLGNELANGTDVEPW